jgi:hypothetical protein
VDHDGIGPNQIQCGDEAGRASHRMRERARLRVENVCIEQMTWVASELVRNPIETPDRKQRVAQVGDATRMEDLLEHDDACERHEDSDDATVNREARRP